MAKRRPIRHLVTEEGKIAKLSKGDIVTLYDGELIGFCRNNKKLCFHFGNRVGTLTDDDKFLIGSEAILVVKLIAVTHNLGLEEIGRTPKTISWRLT